MAYRELLPDEDWQVLQSSIASIFTLIAGSDGKIDKKEQVAIKTIITNSHKLKNSLAKEIMDSLGSSDNLLRLFELQKLPAREILRKAAFILDNKIDTNDALNYKKYMIAIGVYIGNSSGSVFDFKMSYDEMDSLREAGTALNISVKDLEQTNIILDILNTLVD